MVQNDWNLIYIQRDRNSLTDENQFPQSLVNLVNLVFHVAVTAPGPLVEGRTWKHSCANPWKTINANLGTCTAHRFLMDKER